MAANKHTTALSLDNEEMANFTKPKPNPLALLSETLKTASEKPDVHPREQIAGVPVHKIQQQEPTQAYRPTDAAQQDAVRQSSSIAQDQMSYSVDHEQPEVNRGGRPRHGTERKVERTISMPKSLDKMLERLGIIESVRLDRKVSAAEVAVHLMLYGLSNMKDNQILPGDDGRGLALNEAPTEVALPKLGGTMQ